MLNLINVRESVLYRNMIGKKFLTFRFGSIVAVGPSVEVGAGVFVGEGVGEGVVVADTALRAANTAWAALAMPAPHKDVLHELPTGKSVTDERNN